MGSWVHGGEHTSKLKMVMTLFFKYLTGNKFVLIDISMKRMRNKITSKLIDCNNTSYGWFYGQKVASKMIGNYVFSSLNITGVRKCKYFGTYKHQSYLYLLIF